tara:strand:- start:813 stop:1982 length:1170 start_codon:yes stop_codon:yes gene_type:complete
VSIEKPPKEDLAGENTRAIHHGKSFAEATGTIMPPIFPSSTFIHGNIEGFDYTRSGNPNFKILEEVLKSLEPCKYGTVFASGVSAITAITASLKGGDIILCEENLYGCTVRLFEKVFRRFGVKVAWTDFTNKDNLRIIEEIKPSMIWIESPTNPLLKIIDIKSVCTESRKYNIPVVVDNTFATSFVQKPLELGATISLISTTKYINGHSDALGGAVLTNDSEWHKRMLFAQKSLGLHPSPFDCWLITRGVKTVGLRLKQQISNANILANLLDNHNLVEWIRYPFNSNHPQVLIAKKQMRFGGAIITAKLRGTQSTTYSFCKNLKYFSMAESLGGVESLICHPATMTHASIDDKQKKQLGISETLIRLSIGCEDIEDLSKDLNKALSKLQ